MQYMYLFEYKQISRTCYLDIFEIYPTTYSYSTIDECIVK